MKRRPKPVPYLHYIIKSWHANEISLNVGNPDKSVIPDIHRWKREALREIKMLRYGK